MRILIVEDDVDLRVSIMAALRAAGHAPSEARDGLDALRKLHEKELPDVILLDLMMPNLDGHQFRARQLAEPTLASM